MRDAFRQLKNEALARYYDEEPYDRPDAIEIRAGGVGESLLMAIPAGQQLIEAEQNGEWIVGKGWEVRP